MRITHVLFNLRTGGAETMLVDIMNRQVADGDDVTLLLINRGHQQHLRDAIDPRVKVVELGRKIGAKNPLWLLRVNLALHRLHPDVVHVHNKMALGMLYGPRRYAVVFTYHCCGDVNPYSRRPDMLCAISQAVSADVAARGEGSCEIVYNGIDTSAIAMRRPASPQTPPRLVQIGSLYADIKGQHITLRALAAMRHADATVDFYGDGHSRADLEALTHELGLDKRVRFMGTRSRRELYDALPGYDVALLPSLNEGFGLALAEPMAAGVPVVASNLPGPSEVLRDADSILGTTVPAGNPQALADAIDGILDAFTEALALAVDAATSVRRRFDIAGTVARYRELYSSLTGATDQHTLQP